MPGHADILDDQESLAKPFLGSIVFHALVAGLLLWSAVYTARSRETWGLAVPTGSGTVAITPVQAINLPPRVGPKNPVANDTESRVPQAPKEDPRKYVKAPEPDAIPLKSRIPPKPSRTETAQQKYRPEPVRPNQVFSTEAPAAVTQMFQKPGMGSVGVGENTVLGSRFGAYASLIIQRVAEHWQTGGMENLRMAPDVIVSFDLMRDGSAKNPQLLQRSGNSTLDYSTLRAVTEAAPFPPLPPDYSGNVAKVELRFQLKR